MGRSLNLPIFLSLLMDFYHDPESSILHLKASVCQIQFSSLTKSWLKIVVGRSALQRGKLSGIPKYLRDLSELLNSF